MDRTVLALAVLRGLHVTALLGMFGTLVFANLVAQAGLRDTCTRHARLAALAAGVMGVAWLAVQASVFADSWNLASAVPDTLIYSRFGHILGLRLLLIGAAAAASLVPGAGRWIGMVLSGAGLAMQGAVGHAGAAEGNAAGGLIASEALHLLAAGAWLGSLLPLLLCLRTLPSHEARLAAERFSPIGLTAVLAIGATAFVQAMSLIGGFPALVGTDYGRAALVKLGLFVAMLMLALWNRLSLTDRLDTAEPARVRRLLTISVATEACCGLLVVLAAGGLASLVPGVHEQAVWPFASRPSLAVLADPDLRGDVALAIVAMGAGIGAVAVSVFFRRFRIPALLAAIGLTVWQAPNLGLLLVEAYPTSYQRSTTGFTAMSIEQGRSVFAENCAACHGSGGGGGGPAAAALRIKPADLTAGHLWEHRDGELFWWVSFGIENPEGGLAMPGFGDALKPDDRWAVIDFVRTLNAGASMQLSGAWTHPVPAPDFPIACPSDAIDRLTDLRGRFVRIVTAPGSGRTSGDTAVVRLDRVAGQAPPVNGCASATTAAWGAYAAIAGVSADALAGWEFLIDPQGWLRVAHGANGPDWNNPAVLKSALQTLRDQPITSALGGIHVHEH
jgi:putative copper export protein/mono/diheme cytochrome c family protein